MFRKHLGVIVGSVCGIFVIYYAANSRGYEHPTFASTQSHGHPASGVQILPISSVLRTTEESLSFMYGEGNVSEYDPHLLDYVRSFMSRQSSKGRQLSSIKADGHYSQYGGSQRVDELLHRRRNGFFVQLATW